MSQVTVDNLTLGNMALDFTAFDILACKCSNAPPFNLVHFPRGDYPGKLTQRKKISEEELSEYLGCLSEYQQE